MITVVAGSRDLDDYDDTAYAIEQAPWPVTEVIEGEARGPDRRAREYAVNNGIPFKPMPAIWNVPDKDGILRFFKGAGFVRNAAMIKLASALIVVWDGVSSGTSHDIKLALKKGIPIYILIVSKFKVGDVEVKMRVGYNIKQLIPSL